MIKSSLLVSESTKLSNSSAGRVLPYAFIRLIPIVSRTKSTMDENNQVYQRSPSHRACLVPETYPSSELYTSDSGVRGQITRFLPAHGGRDGSSGTHLILIPGNPGVVTYYKPFMHSLSERLSQEQDSTFHCHAVGLPGHDFDRLNGNKTYGISDQEDYFLSYIKNVVSTKTTDPAQQQTKPNIILMGHSYGSFLALRIIERLPSSLYNNVNLVMLMPCMWEMGKCAGMMTRLFLRDPFKIWAWIIALLLSLVPPIVRDFLIRMAGHSAEIFTVTQKLAAGLERIDMYSNMICLGRQEMAQIRSPQHLKGIAKVSSSLAVYAGNDKWCPKQAQASIEEAFGRANVDVRRLGSAVDHAFVLKTAEKQRVVETVAKWVENKFS